MVAQKAGDQVQGQREDDGRVLLGGDAVQGLGSKQYNFKSKIHKYLYNADRSISMRVSVVCRTFSLVRPRDKECVWLVLVRDTETSAG